MRCSRTTRPGRGSAIVDGVGHGDRYRFRLDGGEPLADPASGWQPDGVHGPSAVVDAGAGSRGPTTAGAASTLADTVLYELHVGTFTPAGTLDARRRRSSIGSAALGVTTVELMPRQRLPRRPQLGLRRRVPVGRAGSPTAGRRRWPASSTPPTAPGLGRRARRRLQPPRPGGQRARAGTGRTSPTPYRTPWGDGLNVAGPGSDHVRRTFIESACRWIEDFHVDGLRLDAIDADLDPTAPPFLEQLTDAVHAAGGAAGRTVLVDRRERGQRPARIVRPPAPAASAATRRGTTTSTTPCAWP